MVTENLPLKTTFFLIKLRRFSFATVMKVIASALHQYVAVHIIVTPPLFPSFPSHFWHFLSVINQDVYAIPRSCGSGRFGFRQWFPDDWNEIPGKASKIMFFLLPNESS